MLNIALPPDVEEFVSAKVRSGEYSWVSEVIHDSLYLLQHRDTLHQIKLKRLRKAIAIGLKAADRGELAPLDMEDIIAEEKMRLAVAT